MSDVAGLIGVKARLVELLGAGETLLGFAPTSETDEGVYFLVLRSWDHPEVDGATILSMRYAYLTRGDGGDGWVGGEDSSGAAGINVRIEGDPEEFLGGLAQLVAAAKPRLGGGKQPATKDLRPADRED